MPVEHGAPVEIEPEADGGELSARVRCHGHVDELDACLGEAPQAVFHVAGRRHRRPATAQQQRPVDTVLLWIELDRTG